MHFNMKNYLKNNCYHMYFIKKNVFVVIKKKLLPLKKYIINGYTLFF